MAGVKENLSIHQHTALCMVAFPKFLESISAMSFLFNKNIFIQFEHQARVKKEFEKVVGFNMGVVIRREV